MKFTVLLLLIFLCPTQVFCGNIAFEEDKFEHRFGFGGGTPYGWIGFNLEKSILDYFSLSFGLGNAPEGLGWSVGGRFYPLGQKEIIKRFRPRLSFYYGVVATIEKGTDEKMDEGNAFGIGFDVEVAPGFYVDFEALYLDYNLPSGYKFKHDNDSDWRGAIGFGFYF